ncbi:DUF4279 domain-containing protein [Scytonema hofmannii FACHB-248]|uniref:DUF4279 domain-containing protein n=2 Tax=Scytonema hofmannii TaxID=34078 RepID=A0ABR8GL97_9CYAN|nr:DUF4279 domain-containing protein [[Scytonema hofmanni] UTEX B 1581]MBD2603976.1 DUF4279 domain-containing protein [Scytonema hofmannii FACHB-248]
MAQDITNHLKINPSRSHEKGTPLNPKIPDKNIRDKSSWILQSKLNRESPIEDKINELLDVIQTQLDSFKQIETKINLEIYCSFFLKKESGTFSLPSTTLAKIGSIPINIIVAIYPYDYSGED